MDIIAQVIKYKYYAIFLAVIIEGPIAMTATGFLYRLGYVQLLVAFIVLLIGDLVADVGWYYVGRFGASRLVMKYGKYVSLNEATVSKITAMFRRHENKILVLSKATMGFGFALATLITAGMIRIPIKKFIFLNLIGGLFWTGVLMSLGYFFGHVYLLVAESLRIVFVVAAAVIVMLLLFGFRKFLAGEALKNDL